MRALSIKEPWISLIVSRLKTIETRTWYTGYRGELLLVGCKRPKGAYSGLAACVVNLVDCRPMTLPDSEFAKCDYYDGYSWVLEDVNQVEPFAVRGQQRFYYVPDKLIKPLGYHGIEDEDEVQLKLF